MSCISLVARASIRAANSPRLCTRASSVRRAFEIRRHVVRVSSVTSSNDGGLGGLSAFSSEKAPSDGRPSQWSSFDSSEGGPSWLKWGGYGIGICSSYSGSINRASLRSCFWDGSYTPFHCGRNAFPGPFTPYVVPSVPSDKLCACRRNIGAACPQFGRRFGIRQRWKLRF